MKNFIFLAVLGLVVSAQAEPAALCTAECQYPEVEVDGTIFFKEVIANSGVVKSAEEGKQAVKQQCDSLSGHIVSEIVCNQKLD